MIRERKTQKERIEKQNGRGYDKPIDYKCIEVCLSAPRAVSCMDSAFYYQEAIETEPECLSVATERTDLKKWEERHPIMGFLICTILSGILISLIAGIILEAVY